jgi:hypothetical protein
LSAEKEAIVSVSQRAEHNATLLLASGLDWKVGSAPAMGAIDNSEF